MVQMLIHEGNREAIESVLLGTNRRFQEEQLLVINSVHSTDIVACPGSGKTTVLIAKLALLFEKLKKEGKNKGVCVITHTNVAVEEIQGSLKKLGITNVGYPHFIGTIHEYFNTFFTFKAYQQITHNTNFSILEDADYQKTYQRYYKKNNPGSNITDFRFTKKIDIAINDQAKVDYISNRATPYSDNVILVAKDMFERGLLRHKETLVLSNWYIQKNKEAIQKAFKHRFDYLFVDEAQDTSIEQHANLKLLVENNDHTISQWFGDPYQALYNIYEGNGDSWIPIEEHSLQINYSNRFGESIAKVLRTTCIKPYDTLTVDNEFNSASPHLFIFNDQNKQDVLTAFGKSVSDFQTSLSDAALIKGKVVAVSQHIQALKSYCSAYDHAKAKTSLQSLMQSCLGYCNEALVEALDTNDFPRSRTKKFYSKNISQFFSQNSPALYLELKATCARWIKSLITDVRNEQDFSDVEAKYRQVVATVLKLSSGTIDLSSLTTLEKRTKLLILNHSTAESPSDSDVVEVKLNTIHGVKGETHFATLLLESEDEGRSNLKPIFNFLVGTHQSELLSQDSIIAALKLSYVALSRPRRFAGVAMNQKFLSNSEIEAARSNGWKIVMV